jgi:hypothetical protein
LRKRDIDLRNAAPSAPTNVLDKLLEYSTISALSLPHVAEAVLQILSSLSPSRWSDVVKVMILFNG